MEMQTVQIRLPRSIVEKIDQLVAAGLFRSRSEVLRQSTQAFLASCHYNGSLPFIIGPFKDPDFAKKLDIPLGSLEVPEKDLVELKRKLASVSAGDLFDASH